MAEALEGEREKVLIRKKFDCDKRDAPLLVEQYESWNALLGGFCAEIGRQVVFYLVADCSVQKQSVRGTWSAGFWDNFRDIFKSHVVARSCVLCMIIQYHK